jgi:multicomponent Na+:H+ antiporter subunit C
MNVSLVLIVVMAVLFACGVYAMLERSLTRVLIGFLLLGNATNLLLLIVMGQPGVAPFFGAAASSEEMSDPLPQALTLTAIVITFAVSAFLLALIYRSWQLGQADTVEDDAEDIALRARGSAAEDAMDDETELENDDSTTDFVGLATSPITVLGSRDFAGLRDDAPTDRPTRIVDDPRFSGADGRMRGEEPPRRIRPPEGGASANRGSGAEPSDDGDES